MILVGKNVGFRLEDKFYDKLKEISQKETIPISKLVREIVKKSLSEMEE